MSASKVMPLDEAVQRFVAPGMHLHFASAPSRANAAIRAVCRRFRGKDPRFTLSTTGFHSTAHLLGRLRLGARYIACFFGDNYPTPRANDLYNRLLREGADLEHWSLLSYVTALRAGALGHPYGVTTSILGSSLEQDLVARQRFAVAPDPLDPARRIGLVAAMRPEVAFVHVPAADASGYSIAPLPHGEGPWGALAASQGVVVTTEQIVPPEMTACAPEASLVPPHRVLAVCPAPFGAHPQALFVPQGLDLRGYADDFDAYELWREVGLDDKGHAGLVEDVLLGDDGAYAAHFELERRAPFRAPPAAVAPGALERSPSASERLVVLAARRIAKLARTRGHRVILAGVGHAFFAARLAKLLLARDGVDVDVVVETGMYGIDCGPASGSFLLGFNVIANARRLSSIEDALGVVTCGAGNGSIGVIGAAQVDAQGDLNSTRLADGSLLVGSGGANDIASSADEVVVLSSSDRNRLVHAVPYVTSPGRSVRHVITEDGVLCRDGADAPWRIEDLLEPAGAPAADVAPVSRSSDPFISPPSSRVPISVAPGSDPLSWRGELGPVASRRGGWATWGEESPGARLRRVCPWPLEPVAATPAPPLTMDERRLLRSLNPDRRTRRR